LTLRVDIDEIALHYFSVGGVAAGRTIFGWAVEQRGGCGVLC